MALVVLSLATVPGARAAVLAGPLTNAANAHTYYLLSADTWTASEAEARTLGGHLVTINDAAENLWVRNTFFPLTGVPYASLWIGLNDAANEGQFVWASGEPVTFTYWYPGEPNNLGGEDYATIRHPSESAPAGSWNDLSDTSGFVNPNAPTFGVVEMTLLPVAVTRPADQLMPDGSARLNGLANPSGSPTLAWFEWGTSLAYENATPPQSVGSGSNFVGFSNVLVGLISGTEYHFRTLASNAFGLAAGPGQTFNLNNQRPVVTTLAADQKSTNSAQLRGQVNPRAWPTTAWFEWGTDTNYGNLIGMQDVGQGSSVSNLNVVLEGLMVGPNYHYRLMATNAFGAGYGADQTFNLGIRGVDIAVSVRDNSFNPRHVTNNVNDRVVWTWTGVALHDTTGPGTPPLWSSPLQSSGTYAHVFTTPGRFNYFCTVHSQPQPTLPMVGSVLVQGPPTVTITNPVNDAVFNAPATFAVDASASDPDGSVSQVQFFLDSTSLGTDSVSPYSVNVNNLAAGTYRLSAVATDNQSVRATNSITVIVNAAPPTFSDANWIRIEGIEGASGPIQIRAAVVDGSGNLYIGGFFRTSGDVVATNIAKWNGSRWSALGSGMTNVLALAVSGSDLYAGGQFLSAGGSPANYITKWNGTHWSALGSGMNGSVRALAVSGSNLYAGGDFTTAGGTPASRIAKWDGSTWSALGSGIRGGFDLDIIPPVVYALAVSSSDLYAAGFFTMAGESNANSIAKWAGSSWSALGSGMRFESVTALAVSGSDVYAGGYFTSAGGNPANYIAQWNGTHWSALGSGMNGQVHSLAVSGPALTDLYAGGTFTTAGGSPATNVAKWDGTRWIALGSGMNNSVFALAVSGSSLYAAGSFTTAGGKASVGVVKARIASSAESITASGSSAAIQFSCVVGYEYHVQRTTDLAPPKTWTTVTTSPLSPANDGSLTFTDTNAPPVTAYYRLKQN